MFFLQTIFTSTWGSNGPLWSLANEFWYYLLFGLIILAIQSKKNKFIQFLSLLSLAVICFYTYSNVLPYFTIWLSGVAVYYFRKKNNNKKLAYNIGSAFLLLSLLVLIRLKIAPSIINDYMLGIVVCFFIWANSQTVSVKPFLHKTISLLSNTSYSLYLIHMPICLFFATAINFINLKYSESNMAKWLIIVAIVYAFVYAIWYLFERNTYKIKYQIFKIVK